MSASPSSELGLDEALEGFSVSVRDAFSRLSSEDATVWQLAEALLTLHPDYGGASQAPLGRRDGEARPLTRWLVQLRTLFDPRAVAESESGVIDGRLTLLALARLDDGLDRALRATGRDRRLERELGFGLGEVLRPWALRQPRVEWLELPALQGHEGPLWGVAFSRDGALLATSGTDATVSLWDVATGAQRGSSLRLPEPVRWLEFSPDGTLLAASGARVRLWDVASGAESTLEGAEGAWGPVFSPDGALLAAASEEDTVLWQTAGGWREVLRGHHRPVRRPVFSPNGTLLATAGEDGTARLWEVASGAERAVLSGHGADVWRPAFSRDGALLATGGADGTARVWEVASGDERTVLHGHEGHVWGSVFSPDGTLLATAGVDGTARLWEVESGAERAVLRGHRAVVWPPEFSPDGALLATASEDGTARVWDVASGTQRGVLADEEGPMYWWALSPDGALLARAGDDAARLWEVVEAPSRLPAVAPDLIGGVDQLGVARDAAALANVIAARDTAPPLSIGLFGDWGSGKSFLIGEIRARIQQISGRARRHGDGTSAFCGYVRHIEFNAWHYADANLWASLVAHIFAELAKPEPAAGVRDKAAAHAQLARLEDKLTETSALRGQLERARERTLRLEARRRLLRLTWRLAGAPNDRSLSEVRGDLGSVRGAVRLLLPTGRARLAAMSAVLLVAALSFGVIALLGAGRAWQALGASVGVVTAFGGWLAIARGYAVRLLERVGEHARVIDVSATPADAELEAARAAEADLGRELADLRSGRRLARYITDRSASGDYRAHLGLVSRIHEDFRRMSEILDEQGATPRGPAHDDDEAPPPIDRIVLYIDDLDRCPPARVVEVLEAVHLILAVPLFVVVIAVDPRWLLQSLRVHYSQMLHDIDQSPVPPRDQAAQDPSPRAADPADELAWQSTPLHYLEKIIQLPFAVRPMGTDGVRALVHS